MASSSKRSAGKRKGALAGEGDPPVTGEATAAPRGRGDDGSSSSSSSGPLESLEEVLGRLTVDPWYRSSERFPSVLVTHGWLSEKMPWQMWPGFLPSERSETCKYKGRRFRPPVYFIPSLSQGPQICFGILRHCGSQSENGVRPHTFFFAYSELTVTLEDIENYWLLPILGDQDPAEVELSPEEVRKQFGFDQEVPAVMGVAASEIPIVNPFLKTRAFAYWNSVAPQVVIPSGNRVSIYTTGMSNYWRELIAVMVEFRNNGRGDISHLLQACISPLPHPHLFLAINTMTTYANRQSLGYTVWCQEELRWMIFGDHHPSLWLRDHPHVPAPGKVASNRGMRTALTGTPTAKEGQSSRSKKKEAPIEESAAQGVSAPVSKRPVRKTRAGKRTFATPASSSVPASIASKQRTDTLNYVPLMIPIVHHPRSDKTESILELLQKELEVKILKLMQQKLFLMQEAVAAEVNSDDKATASDASSGEKDAVAEASTDEDAVSMDELEAVEASFDDVPVASASNPRFVERAIDEHTAVGAVTSAVRAAETVPIIITSSVSTDSEKTISATPMVPTPSSPLPESGGIAPTPTVIAAVVSAAATIQEDETVPTAAKETPGQIAASENPVLVDVTLGSDILVMEGTFAQDPTDNISMENMADTHDSYDAVLAGTEENVVGTQIADLEVTAPAATHMSPTRTAGSGNEAVAEEEGRHQTAVVESTAKGQPGLLSATRSATLGSSVLTEMDAFFREFDQMLLGATKKGVQLLEALWKKHDSCSVYLKLGVYVGSFMLTLLYCVLAHMEHTRLEDIIEVHVLEWKAVVQEITREGFKFNFILDYLRRLAHDMFSRRILAELRAVEARAAALRDALNIIAPEPVGFGFC
uniref:Aminotransferase-like plant mobile domain-containing protein n=1 Tax=Fagus sylvatica TaxID=28930 RepID=A0A2N9ETN5_FAGSY